MNDKRTHSRVPKKMKSEVKSSEAMTYSTVRDVSDGGVFISTPEPVSPGLELELSLRMPDGDILDVMGTVRWIKDESEDGSPAGMGIEFKSVSPEAEKKIRSLLS